MNMNQLPSYISGQSKNVAQRARALVPTGSPPYMSIAGGHFTLVDAAGNTRQFQTLYADVVIIDVNDHLSKIFFPDNYKQGDNTPPLCFSDNGVGPSRNATQPQSPTCGSCQWGDWGSKISQMGSRVKACADQQKVVLIVPGLPNQEFLLRIPPNSLKGWAGYLDTFRHGYDVTDIVTRISFEEGVLGTLRFEPSPEAFFDNPKWQQCNLLQNREAAWHNPAVNQMIGRTDEAAQGLIGGPGFRGGSAAPALPPAGSPPGVTVSPGALLSNPNQPAPMTHAPAVQQPPQFGGQLQGTPQPAQTAPARRGRRGRQPAAQNGQQSAQGAPQAPFPHGNQASFAPAVTTAPGAPTSPAPAAAPANPAPFGMAQGQAPGSDIERMLNDTFGPNFRSPA
jgi:hypothetical protein